MTKFDAEIFFFSENGRYANLDKVVLWPLYTDIIFGIGHYRAGGIK